MGSQELPATRTTRHTMFCLLLLLGLATSSPLDRGAPDKQIWCSSRRGKGKRSHSPGRTSRTLMCQLERPLIFSTDTGSFPCQCAWYPVMTMALGSSGNQPPRCSHQVLFVRSSNLWPISLTHSFKYFSVMTWLI